MCTFQEYLGFKLSHMSLSAWNVESQVSVWGVRVCVCVCVCVCVYERESEW